MKTEKHKIYTIAKIEDIIEIPREKWDDVFVDMRKYIEVLHAVWVLNELAADIFDGDLVKTVGPMKWEDDGKYEAQVNIKMK